MLSKTLVLILMMMLALATAFGQRLEVQPFVGYKFGGGIDVGSNVLNIQRINFDSTIAGGVTAGFNFNEKVAIEFLWNRQPTKAVGQLVGGGNYNQTIDVKFDQYHGNFLYTFKEGEKKIRPFILAGAGATHWSGAGSSGTKFSYALGGGVKYYFNKHMGVRLQARWAPTYVYTSAGGVWCNWWGYCWVVGNAHYLQQGDATAGWMFRF